jgi:hypothetical protein
VFVEIGIYVLPERLRDISRFCNGTAALHPHRPIPAARKRVLEWGGL